METIYQAVMTALKADVTALNWIDLDRGQVDFYVNEPPVAYPCALIDVSLTDCESIYPDTQQGAASIGVRIVQNPYDTESGVVPAQAAAQARSLDCYRLLEEVYNALQGLEIGVFSPLSRVEQHKEMREDGLFVYRIVFETWMDDLVD